MKNETLYKSEMVDIKLKRKSKLRVILNFYVRFANTKRKAC